jgi:hypothetical protein
MLAAGWQPAVLCYIAVFIIFKALDKAILSIKLDYIPYLFLFNKSLVNYLVGLFKSNNKDHKKRKPFLEL